MRASKKAVRYMIKDEIVERMCKNLPYNLRRLRKAKNLSQAEVAKDLHTNQSTYANWETGHALPGLFYVLKLIMSFKVSINELVKECQVKEVLLQGTKKRNEPLLLKEDVLPKQKE